MNAHLDSHMVNWKNFSLYLRETSIIDMKMLIVIPQNEIPIKKNDPQLQIIFIYTFILGPCK